MLESSRSASGNSQESNQFKFMNAPGRSAGNSSNTIRDISEWHRDSEADKRVARPEATKQNHDEFPRKARKQTDHALQLNRSESRARQETIANHKVVEITV